MPRIRAIRLIESLVCVMVRLDCFEYVSSYDQKGITSKSN
jgi:hypothetical protein